MKDYMKIGKIIKSDTSKFLTTGLQDIKSDDVFVYIYQLIRKAEVQIKDNLRKKILSDIKSHENR